MWAGHNFAAMVPEEGQVLCITDFFTRATFDSIITADFQLAHYVAIFVDLRDRNGTRET